MWRCLEEDEGKAGTGSVPNASSKRVTAAAQPRFWWIGEGQRLDYWVPDNPTRSFSGEKVGRQLRSTLAWDTEGQSGYTYDGVSCTNTFTLFILQVQVRVYNHGVRCHL